MGEVIIYTDGACHPNPGRGGWAAILRFSKEGKILAEREISGGLPKSTNNRAEIIAVLKPLQLLTRPCSVTIYTDSKYVRNSIGYWCGGEPGSPQGWMVNWERLGWRRREGELLNLDLWQELIVELRRHKRIVVKFVRGHNGDVFNERCDVLAVKARRALAGSC